MFKKREKNQNALKRTTDDRYLDESETISVAKTEEPGKKRLKAGNAEEAVVLNKASTLDHKHYRQEYIEKEVQEMAAFGLRRRKDSREGEENPATKQLEIDTAVENDAIARAKKNIEISKGIKEGRLDPKVYRGLNGYQNYIE